MNKLWIENIETLPAVKYQETEPPGDWFDKTNDAVSWDKYGAEVVDYWFVLGKIKNILIPKANPNYPTIDFSGWNTLTDDEKKVMSRCIYAPYSLRVPDVFTDSQDIFNAETLLEKSYGINRGKLTGRLGLVEDMRQYVFLNYVRKDLMSLADSKQFGKDTSQLLDWFERFASSDFYQWLINEAGSPYENDGFAEKSYYSTQLKDELLTLFTGP